MKEFKNKFKFKSILHKMLASFLTIIIFILIIIATSVFSASQASSETNEIIQDRIPAMLKLESLAINFANRNRAAHEFLVTNNSARISEFKDLSEESAILEQELLKLYDNEEITEVIELTADWTNEVDARVIDQNSAGNNLTAISNMNVLSPKTNKILEIYQDNISYIENEMEANAKRIENVQRISVMIIIAVGVLAIAISVLIAWFTTKSITKPLSEMKNRLEAFSQEDFSADPMAVETNDEIGELASALNLTQGNLVALMMSVQEASNVLSNSSNEITDMNREVHTGSSQIAATMQELASGAEAQANSASNLATDMNIFSTTTKETLEYGQEITQSSEEI